MRPLKTIAGGRIRGLTNGGVASYLGIPYAAVERFRPPLAGEGWDGVRDCTEPGPVPPQPERKMAQFTHGPLPPTDEQSLSLNVWHPEDADGCPVLVWLHGGGFTMGWGSAPPYDGSRFAAANRAVVVTINYRLGSLGWLCHPDLADRAGAPCGNWGLLDQQAALRWVRENIEAFGGDASNVTVAGQSAGASCAMAQLADPTAEGLFRRLILQSPLIGNSAGPTDLAYTWAEAMSERAGGSGSGLDREALLALEPGRLIEIHEELMKDPRFHGVSGAQPTLEEHTIPRSPAAEPRLSPAVDVLTGTTSEEAAFWFMARQKSPTDQPDEAALIGVLGHAPGIDDAQEIVATERDRVIAAGEDWGPTAFVRLATAEMFAKPLAAWTDERRRGGSLVFGYEVAHRGPVGALHSVEVPLVFGTFDDGDGPGSRLAGAGPTSAAVSADMMRSWGAFIRDSDPGWAQDELREFGG